MTHWMHAIGSSYDPPPHTCARSVGPWQASEFPLFTKIYEIAFEGKDPATITDL